MSSSRHQWPVPTQPAGPRLSAWYSAQAGDFVFLQLPQTRPVRPSTILDFSFPSIARVDLESISRQGTARNSIFRVIGNGPGSILFEALGSRYDDDEWPCTASLFHPLSLLCRIGLTASHAALCRYLHLPLYPTKYRAPSAERTADSQRTVASPFIR